jgi:hypothetical protein
MNYLVLNVTESVLECDRYDDEYQTWYTETRVFYSPICKVYEITPGWELYDENTEF